MKSEIAERMLIHIKDTYPVIRESMINQGYEMPEALLELSEREAHLVCTSFMIATCLALTTK